jgi:hypothetical protein
MLADKAASARVEVKLLTIVVPPLDPHFAE